MAEGGFITIHRKIDEWPLWQRLRADQQMVVIRLIMMANWKPGKARIGTIERGQLLATEGRIAEAAKVGRQVVRTVLRSLERDGFIVRQINPHGNHHESLITIRNYDRFQSPPTDNDQPANQHLTSIQPAPNQLLTPIEPEEPVNQGTSEPKISSRKRRVKRPDQQPDPRREQLIAKAAEAFRELRKDGYRFKGARDGKAVNEMMAAAGDAEILRRWRMGLQSTGYLRLNYLHELNDKWNAFAGEGPAPPYRNGSTLLVTEPSKPEAFAVKGDQPL